MVIWLYKLDCAILLVHEVLDGCLCLIIGDIECWLESFVSEDFEDGREYSHDVTVSGRVDGDSKNVVRIVSICNKDKLLAIQGPCGRFLVQSVCSFVLVSQCSKTEYFHWVAQMCRGCCASRALMSIEAEF